MFHVPTLNPSSHSLHIIGYIEKSTCPPVTRGKLQCQTLVHWGHSPTKLLLKELQSWECYRRVNLLLGSHIGMVTPAILALVPWDTLWFAIGWNMPERGFAIFHANTPVVRCSSAQFFTNNDVGRHSIQSNVLASSVCLRKCSNHTHCLYRCRCPGGPDGEHKKPA